MNLLLPLLVGGVGFVALLGYAFTGAGDHELEPNDDDAPLDPTDGDEPEELDAMARAPGTNSIPPAVGNPQRWPLDVPPKWSRYSFGQPRPSRGTPTRWHCGVDIKGAVEGDVVYATEPGTVIATQGWSGSNAKALLVRTDSGLTLVFGALAPRSWLEFNVRRGTRVVAGTMLGRLGTYPKGDVMLHFETYDGAAGVNSQWLRGEPAPPLLRHPNPYLAQASSRSA